MQVTDEREALLLSDAVSIAIEVLRLLPEDDRPRSEIVSLSSLLAGLPLSAADRLRAQQTATRRLAILFAKPSADILPFPPR